VRQRASRPVVRPFRPSRFRSDDIAARIPGWPPTRRRLQTLMKKFGRSVLANGKAARGAAGGAAFDEVGNVEVRGKARPVTALAVEGRPTKSPAPAHR
jgi:hypothetical protein